MKNIVKIIFCIIYLSPLISKDIGYYIYKFSIDKTDLIKLDRVKFIDSVLKPQGIEKAIKDPIHFKIKDDQGQTLFKGQIGDPRRIHHEDFSSSLPTRKDFLLDKSSFVVKSPILKNQKKIEFFKHENGSASKGALKKLIDVELKLD